MNKYRHVWMVMGALWVASLSAQSYQTSFASVSPDRAKSPALFHSGVKVDVASGAADMSIPLGPGIGRAGLHFVPSLQGHLLPNVHASYDRGVFNGTVTHDNKAFSLTPGHFNLAVPYSWNSTNLPSSYQFPDGSTGSLARKGINDLPAGASVDVGSMLSQFGYSDCAVGSWNYAAWVDASASCAPVNGTPDKTLGLGTNGELIIPLSGGRHPAKSCSSADFCYEYVAQQGFALLNAWIPHNQAITVPGAILVVQGAVAYEFVFSAPHYRWQKNPEAANGTPAWGMQYAHYTLARMRNRFGESIVFANDTDCIGFTATYYQGATSSGADGTATGPSLRIKVESISNVAPPNGIGQTNVPGAQAPATVDVARLSIAYLGDAKGLTYSLDAAGSEGILARTDAWKASMLAGHPFVDVDEFDRTRQRLLPIALTCSANAETVAWTYAASSTVTMNDDGGHTLTEGTSILKSVDFTGHRIDLIWSPYRFVTNVSSDPYRFSPSLSNQFNWAWGVSGVTETDPVKGSVRATTYTRSIPATFTLDTSGTGSGTWNSTTFSASVVHPDGQRTEYDYLQPNPAAMPSDRDSLGKLLGWKLDTSTDLGMQLLGFLKHQVLEERHFDATGGGLYAKTDFDRWDTRRAGNSKDPGSTYSTPYPTRIQHWNYNTGVMNVSEMGDWDPQGAGWKTARATTSAGAGSLGFSYRSLAITEGSPSATGNRQTVVTGKGYASACSLWLLGRLTSEQSTIQTDDTGSMADALPAALPLKRTTYDASVPSRITDVTLSGGSDAVKTSFTFTGGYGSLMAQLPTSASLSGAYLNSGAGVSYGYDGFGQMSSITDAKGFTVSRTTDVLGRPQDQTDNNGVKSTFAPDALGRITTLAPPAPELGTTYTYDADGRGVTISQGDGGTYLKYDGFGQLVSEKRWAKGLTTSTRAFSYDAAGRKTFESGWGVSVGTTWTYDGQGRVMDVVDANGKKVHTSYNGFDRVVTRGYGTADAAATTYTSDAVGRLACVTDALGQVTRYKYDGASRIRSVNQSGQIRTWTYNGLGWLTSLTQPESGLTQYSNFTVTGKPQRTTYPSVTVDASFDVLDRVTSVGSSDNSVSASYAYDVGIMAKGRLSSATYGGVTRTLSYGGLNGRLSQMTRTVDGQTFAVNVEQDAYGNLSARTLPSQRRQSFTYYDGSGLAKDSSADGALVASFAYYDHWGLQGITYVNSATSGFTYNADQGQLNSMQHHIPGTPDKTWNYAYDGRNNLLTDGEDTFGYDPLDRLTKTWVRDLSDIAGQGITQEFKYDAWGNRTYALSQLVTNWTTPTPPSTPVLMPTPATVPTSNLDFRGGAAESSLGDRNQLPAHLANGALTGAQYDAQGNLTRIFKVSGDANTQITLTYDALGKVVGMSDARRGMAESYSYDDLGLRIRIVDSTGKTSYNIYDEARHLVAQYDKPSGGSLRWKADMLYSGDKELAEVDNCGTMVTLTDHLGTSRFAWRGAGDPLFRQKFMPFGENLTDPQIQAALSKGFTNHEQTDASGLIYMQARIYLPMYGRFASPDPARDQHYEETQSWNIYSYVRNNPVVMVDPTGLEKLDRKAPDGSEWAQPTRLQTLSAETVNAQTNTAAGNGGNTSAGSTGIARASQLLELSKTSGISFADAARLLIAAGALADMSTTTTVVANGSLGANTGGDSNFTDRQALVASGNGVAVNTQFIRMTQGAVGNLQDWAHEGTHNADRAAQAANLIAGLSPTITNLMTERNAYTVTQLVLRLTHTSAAYSGVVLWDNTWSRLPSGPMNSRMSTAINNLMNIEATRLGSSANSFIVPVP